MAAGLLPESATVQHPAELGCLVRESQPRNLTETEAGVPGRIGPGKERKAVSVEHDNAVAHLGVAQGRTVREILHGNLLNVLQVIPDWCRGNKSSISDLIYLGSLVHHTAI